MRALGEEVEKGGEDVRGEWHGRFQGRADIPAMDDKFKEARMGQGVRGNNAEHMIAGLTLLANPKRLYFNNLVWTHRRKAP